MQVDLSNIIKHVQPQFKDDFKKQLTNDYLENMFIYISGRSGGKTYDVCMILIMRDFMYPDADTLVVQKTKTAIKDASYSAIKKIIYTLGLEDCYEFKVSPLEISNKITRSKFVFKGCDDGQKLKGIENIATVFVEEADLLTKDDWYMIKPLLRDRKFKDYAKSYHCFNPSTPFTFYKDLIDEPEKYNCKVHKSYYYNNPFVSEDYMKDMDILKETDPDRYKRDGLGEFGAKDGLCITKKVESFDPKVRYGFNPFTGNGLDFGFKHAQVFVNLTYYNDTNTLVINEVIDRCELTNGQHIDLIPDKYKNTLGWSDHEPGLIMEAASKGFKFTNAHKSKVTSNFYIDFINSLDHLVVRSSAASFTRECGIWSYINETDTPKKVDDDINDAVRYALDPILLDRIEGSWEVGHDAF